MNEKQRNKLRAAAEAAALNQHDGMALNRYGELMAPAVCLALLDEIDRLNKGRGELAGYRVQRIQPTGNARLDRPLLTLATPEEWGDAWKADALYVGSASSERMLVDAAVSLGSIGEALGLDMDADADAMIGTARDLVDGLNRIIKECPLGSPGFAIATEVMGELGVVQEPGA